jgi:hypothetical protein
MYLLGVNRSVGILFLDTGVKHASLRKRTLRELYKYDNFYCCTVHYGIYILLTHQQMDFLLILEKFKFTCKYI